MDNEVYSFALKSTLSEIQSICPDIKNSFIFTHDGEIIAADENTSEKIIVSVVDSFDSILEKADALGGFESATLDSARGKLNVSCLNDFYLVTVTSRSADKNYVNAVTRVLIPTILRLLEKISPTPLKNEPYETEARPKIPMTKDFEKPLQKPAEEPIPEEPKKEVSEVKSETPPPEPPVNQFIVENIGGLLVPADTVRVDNELLLQWQELYPEKRIEQVEIETFGGKSTQCKVKPIKDSKYEGKGIVQMPEKIQSTLDIKKGELVRVKPLVE